MDTISNAEILAEIAGGLADWRKLAQPLAARYRATDAVAGAAFVAAVARAAAAARYDVPEIRLGRGVIDVTLFSVDEAGARRVTARTLNWPASSPGLPASST
ncbi:hypothetical protein ACWDSL_23905 [Streptomyces sp. NPDC000941]